MQWPCLSEYDLFHVTWHDIHTYIQVPINDLEYTEYIHYYKMESQIEKLLCITRLLDEICCDSVMTVAAYSFIHSIGTNRVRWFIAVLSSFFHSSLLCTFSCHPSPRTILPSSLTSSCHLFLGLPLSLVVPKFIYNNPFWEFYFLPFSVHAQTNVIYLTLLSLL